MTTATPPGEPPEAWTIFHLTHWKAGSQWVRSVLKHAAPERFTTPRPGPAGPIGMPVVKGAIYAPVYASPEQLRAEVPDDASQRAFVVIRDPRDTLVSWYFSLMYSHAPDEPTVQESRDELRGLGREEGLALMIDRHLCAVTAIQQGWLAAGARVFRYEDLRANQQEAFRLIFEFCRLDVPESRRRRIVRRHSFIRRTWWRFGRESKSSHLRKGVPGDWKNYFTDDLKRLFKGRHGATLALAGYEKDDSW